MADRAALQRLREGRFFKGWDGAVASDRVEASEASMRQLIDALLAAGPEIDEDEARDAVGDCIDRFNELDDEGWINTIEREEIAEQIGRVVGLCGFEFDEDWLDERDW
ncbi:hypothetical protein AB1L88_25020 [Tautonia sp. JC769]|uniref:hypothetical protein n=1 Tax=Tautonia sp. JC769 TaxID=3232135 RepID=UPI0034599A63